MPFNVAAEAVGAAPLVPYRMQIGVAHAAKQNVDLDVVRRRPAAADRERREWGIGPARGMSFDVAI